ncbi:MAG: hypothetical protein IJQ56_08985 [Synergistaceae bacterium]|nr:hypothetical protein [Synergistaceae bacterium]
MPAKNIEVIEDKNLSSNYDKRYVVVDKDTGEVLDDAQGYGYRSVQKAYAAYGYKTRDKSKDAEKRAKKRSILKWLKEHKGFNQLMEDVAFDCMKCGEPFNAALVKKMLKENNYAPDFTAGELLRVWSNRKD